MALVAQKKPSFLSSWFVLPLLCRDSSHYFLWQCTQIADSIMELTGKKWFTSIENKFVSLCLFSALPKQEQQVFKVLGRRKTFSPNNRWWVLSDDMFHFSCFSLSEKLVLELVSRVAALGVVMREKSVYNARMQSYVLNYILQLQVWMNTQCQQWVGDVASGDGILRGQQRWCGLKVCGSIFTPIPSNTGKCP